MFDTTSRYALQPTATHRGRDGRVIVHVTRRDLPRPSDLAGAVQTHEVREVDRLDRITAATLGDPTLFWRICDANGAMHPDDLLRAPGRRLVIDRLGRAGAP